MQVAAAERQGDTAGAGGRARPGGDLAWLGAAARPGAGTVALMLCAIGPRVVSREELAFVLEQMRAAGSGHRARFRRRVAFLRASAFSADS